GGNEQRTRSCERCGGLQDGNGGAPAHAVPGGYGEPGEGVSRVTSRAAVDAFIAGRTLAVAGASADPRKFGNLAYRELKKKGYRVLAVNPRGGKVDGDPVYRSLAELPLPVDGLLIVVPRRVAPEVVREAAVAGIRRVWLQQGADSTAALEACREAGLECVSGECILMFAPPVRSVHALHRLVWGWLGRLPRETRE
ncbi:MAG: CoA-binding protein, partial [Syntrophomonadaceae bacterium]|nr:CoA-binding protein [Syntrophomonadaceae bacterium]